MRERALVISVPVIHRGYLDLFRRLAAEVRTTYILGDELAARLRFFETEIAALPAEDARRFVAALGVFQTVALLTPAILGDVRAQPLVFVSDELSKRMAREFFPEADIRWETVFLRWDESHVASVVPVNFSRQSDDPHDREILKLAYAEAKQSGDWWRQVGALLVKDGRVTGRAYNRDMPDDQSSYRLGNIRDFVKPGERPEISNTLHAENRLIAEAARAGVSTDGAYIYATHFPCPMCAKVIAVSGIRKCFFSEGSANFDAEMILAAYGVETVYVPR